MLEISKFWLNLFVFEENSALISMMRERSHVCFCLFQIFIFLFVVSITFIIVNMFLTILNETFSTVRGDLTKQKNDYEIVDFMMGR